MRNHVLPYFSALPLGSVTPTDVQGFVAHLEGKGLAPSTVRQCWLLAQGVFSSAVDSDLIPKTPCRGINLPRPRHNEVRALTPEQVAIVADAIAARHRALVLTAANTGMRFGELAGLRVRRLDLLKRTVTVVEQLTEVRGGVEYSEPKHGSRRTVTLPRFLCDELAFHLTTYPSVGGNVFTMPEGGPLRRSNFRRRVWLPTVNATGLEDFTFHSLRHAHAAALIALGEHPKVISSRLGHSSISVTMDTYGHLFDGLDARAADRLDEAHTRSSAPISRPSASSEVAQLFS
jgi:integrase